MINYLNYPKITFNETVAYITYYPTFKVVLLLFSIKSNWLENLRVYHKNFTDQVFYVIY